MYRPPRRRTPFNTRIEGWPMRWMIWRATSPRPYVGVAGQPRPISGPQRTSLSTHRVPSAAPGMDRRRAGLEGARRRRKLCPVGGRASQITPSTSLDATHINNKGLKCGRGAGLKLGASLNSGSVSLYKLDNMSSNICARP